MAIRKQVANIWQQLDELVPTLNRDEQKIIYDDMRHNAVADIDFYLLILLASGIAYFGLQQNSSVVIIGAMLVAPLMSPMMAMGFSIVNGNLRLFWRSAVSTLSGMALAVGVSGVITFLFPLKNITEQILARTGPTILDLFVALISGMAGAYALGRKEVSASLPGVAIAASLVPPLCVVGFGLGSGNLDIASRALLLFTTNLASII
ncbi:MAG: TIGR00341 family protein, partial [Chloroflexota bacterium]